MVEGGESAPHNLESSELKGLELQTEVFLQNHGNGRLVPITLTAASLGGWGGGGGSLKLGPAHYLLTKIPLHAYQWCVNSFNVGSCITDDQQMFLWPGNSE